MVDKKTEKNKFNDVDASPVKSFFVSMLTRDISLPDAILDLLDNCVDGIHRKKTKPSSTKPYDGFYAEISFDKDSFSIQDNCGGIPWKLHEYAFRMGRSSDREEEKIGTVGTYGIGMKRALFKIGQHCLITTKNKEDNYEVEISPDWLTDEENWKIPVKISEKSMDEDGTIICIGDLHPGISILFGHDQKSFMADFIKQVETHYAFIIDKGFKVTINGQTVKAKPTQLIFDKKKDKKESIQPYIYTAEEDGVEIFLAVGFTQPIPSVEEVIQEQTERKYSSLQAGWTVLCNDRAVLYCDKTELTGWGTSGVPRYHTQFIAISGIVEFKCKDPSKLPTTTTKRGIEGSSRLYLKVKDKMQEGMRLFIDYTNNWKGQGDVKISKEHMDNGEKVTLPNLKKESESLKFNPVQKGVKGGKQYKPSLPRPPRKESDIKRISFTRKVEEIRIVGEYLFGDPDTKPAQIGEQCFKDVLKEAKD